MTVGENGDVVVADEEMPLHSRIPTIKYIFVENTPGHFTGRRFATGQNLGGEGHCLGLLLRRGLTGSC